MYDCNALLWHAMVLTSFWQVTTVNNQLAVINLQRSIIGTICESQLEKYTSDWEIHLSNCCFRCVNCGGVIWSSSPFSEPNRHLDLAKLPSGNLTSLSNISHIYHILSHDFPIYSHRFHPSPGRARHVAEPPRLAALALRLRYDALGPAGHRMSWWVSTGPSSWRSQLESWWIPSGYVKMTMENCHGNSWYTH